ncbi:YdbH domain-containing protein [Methylomonas sp. LL1]|uniref:YdbH domain-containing protein n=1 Tax=Methylomonas sp. LL1 TaxID=2785785 RepID=UPI0018C381BF|nr:YdbH domain-containing protein [Methylomonas sp. LL1]QPK62826.1 YdbH domain-containing protein [Methylomonas sp. LL1]
MSDQRRIPSSRLRLFAVFLSVLLVAGLGIWWGRGMLMQWGVRQLLQRLPLLEPVASGIGFDFDQARLEHIQFGLNTAAGPATVRLQEVWANYNLRASKLDSIRVAQAQLRFAYQPSDQAAGNDQPTSTVALIPLQRITIDSLDLQIETPQGAIVFNGSAELDFAPEKPIRAIFQDTQQTIRLELAPDLRGVKLQVEQAAGGNIFELNYQQLDQLEHRAHLSADAGLLLKWLTTSSLMPAQLKQNMAASSAVQANPNITAIKLSLSAESHDKLEHLHGRLMLTRDGGYLSSADLALNTATTRLDLDGHLDLSASEAIELARPWLPETMNDWRFSTGHLMGTLHLGWRPQSAPTGSAYLTAYQLGLSVGAIRADEGHIQLDIQDLAHLSMTLSMEVAKLALGEKTTVRDLMVKARYQQNLLTLERATLPLFGGRLEVLPQIVNIDQLPVNLTLGVHNIDLSQLLDSFNYPALSGTGTISGKLPLRLGPDTIEVSEGELTATEPGVLRYQGPATDDESIAFNALRNMLYHSLQAKVNYRPNGEYRIGLRLEGKNPQVLSGHPIAFNLNLSGQLPELLQKGILAGNFDQPVLDQVKNGGQPKKPAKPQ